MRIILLVLALLLQGACAIKSYSPSLLANTQSVLVHERLGTLSFTYLTNERDGWKSLPQKSETVRKILEQHSGYSSIIALSEPPTKGPHVNVTLRHGPPPSTWVYMTVNTFHLIPGYFNGIMYDVQFDVFADNLLTHTYRHEIKVRAIGWIGLLPFVWINLFTTHFIEAFEATVYQFVTEAISDGVL
ncbi:MAG: hypothetical protein KF722_14490 [Nitrospira sp.]|nr:hypothetical protein [Nitrospira sp.]